MIKIAREDTKKNANTQNQVNKKERKCKRFQSFRQTFGNSFKFTPFKKVAINLFFLFAYFFRACFFIARFS